MKISALYIVKNETSNLRRSVESLAAVADELIVVDTGSTDDTVAVAQSLGARVERFEWVDDFSAARNFALSLAAGDIIIFLDADNWFDPPLAASDHGVITGFFASNPRLDCVSVVVREVDPRTGAVKSTTCVENRIYLNNGKIRYTGRVHEHLDGVAYAAKSDHFRVNHSGYAPGLLEEKAARNIGLLEAGLADSKEGGREWVRFLMYLVREYHHAGRIKEAAECLVKVLKHHAVIKELCVFHSEEFISCVYAAILTAFKERGRVGRLEVRDKLFSLFEQAYPTYPGTAQAGLLYQALFDMKEDRFLREWGRAMREAERLRRPDAVTYYRDYERYLYEKAALASWRRGDRLSAMERAVAALKNGGKHLRNPFAIMMTAVKDQPAHDIILFLNSIYDVTDPADLDTLIARTRIEGLQDVHAYYAKKRIDLGAVRAQDYICLMLAVKKYDAAAGTAIESYAAGNKPVALYLFMAAVCGASPEITGSQMDGMLSGYAHILSAYHKGVPLPAVTGQDARLLPAAYPIVAFAAGFGTADKLRAVFAADPALCFRVKASYCEECNCLERLLEEDLSGIAPTDAACRRFIIQAMIFANRYDDALAQIELVTRENVLEQDILHQLLVVAEKAGGDAGANARRLYDKYIAVYDGITDDHKKK